eukprot:g7336.t1
MSLDATKKGGKKGWWGRKKSGPADEVAPPLPPGSSSAAASSDSATAAPADDFDAKALIVRLEASDAAGDGEGPAGGGGGNVLTQAEIFALVARCRRLFLSQPPLIEIKARVNVCGDVHGQFHDLLRLFELGGAPSAENPYLFLGDYVDRGKQSIETICLLLCYKFLLPDHFHLLRGNHESANINRLYGFFDECKRRYSVKLWRVFCDCFNCLPIAALVSKSIICMHGGLSPEFVSLDQLDSVKRPSEVGDSGLICDLLWADPKPDVTGWVPSDRGVSWGFGADKLAEFLEKHDLDLVCRAHQVVEDGYEFFAGRKLVTVFSAPNYCGTFDNDGALKTVSDDLRCSFKILRAAKSQD